MHIPHDQTRTESTPHFAHPTLLGRQRTWETLCRAGAPLTWLPRMCDVAMNHFANAKSVPEICAAPEFAAHCEAHPYPYAGLTVTGPLALEALTDPRRTLFARYIRAQLKALGKHRNLPEEQQRLDASELLEEVLGRSIPKFRVGAETESGGMETWGWEAYLALRLVRSVGDKVRTRGRFVPEAADSEVFRKAPDEAADPNHHFLRCAVRDTLAQVLRRLLTTPREQSIYRGLVYRDHGYEQLAAEHGCSITTIANDIAVPLIASLQEKLRNESAVRGAKTSFRLLREPLAQSLPEHVFDELMAVRLPCPVQPTRDLQPSI